MSQSAILIESQWLLLSSLLQLCHQLGVNLFSDATIRDVLGWCTKTDDQIEESHNTEKQRDRCKAREEDGGHREASDTQHGTCSDTLQYDVARGRSDTKQRREYVNLRTVDGQPEYPRIGVLVIDALRSFQNRNLIRVKEAIAIGVLKVLQQQPQQQRNENDAAATQAPSATVTSDEQERNRHYRYWSKQLLSMYDFAVQHHLLSLLETLYGFLRGRLTMMEMTGSVASSCFEDVCIDFGQQLPVLASLPKRMLWDVFSFPCFPKYEDEASVASSLRIPPFSLSRLLSPTPVILSSRIPISLDRPSLWRVLVHQPCTFELDVMSGAKIKKLQNGRCRTSNPVDRKVS